MLDSSWIQLLVIIGLPYFIGAIRSFFAKAPQPSPLQLLNSKQAGNNTTLPQQRRLSHWDRSILLLLALTTCYHSYHFFLYNPPNIFRALSLPPESPNFILHQAWKQRAEHDPSNSFMIQYPESMRERFKAMENRLIYEIYGQDAFLNCDHCTERSDYLLYLLPGALGSYVATATILGLTTTQTSHLNKYRTWGSVALIVLAIIEYSTFQRGGEIVTLAILKQKGLWVGFRGAHLIRHGSLAMMSVVIMALLQRSVRMGPPRDEIEILNELCQAQEAMIQRHRALQLARVASLRDPLLRKQFVEYWRKREIEHSLILADSEFREARELARSRIDVAGIMQQAQQYTEEVIRAGERASEETDAGIRAGERASEETDAGIIRAGERASEETDASET
ncbi:hypothetical protein BGZ65_002992 [Modicella reniformis]|uniref:Uncharacterized protein n=1 Tax=Modicella reniformis TaxID=1440133 RepID=A0A9P6J396_9FUNG|nr:hypothetical protein BGZ65_002992 [Modicella reniformis]